MAVWLVLWRSFSSAVNGRGAAGDAAADGGYE